MQVGRRSARAAAIGIVSAVALALSGSSAAAAERPAFGAAQAMEPHFSWQTRDYVLRGCDSDQGVELNLRGARRWLTAIEGSGFRSRDYSDRIGASAGESVTVGFRKRGHKAVRRYHLRCLPDNFPTYSFDRERPGGPKMFSQQIGTHFGAIIDSNGVPVWWYELDGEPDNLAVMKDGTVSLAPVDQRLSQVGDYEVRSLSGRLLHHFGGVGKSIVDVHDLRLLPNGNYLLGAQVTYPEDLTDYGRPADSQVIGIQIQERSPDGDLVWKWSSRGKIGLEETGRWWDSVILQYEPYDIVHWNAVDKQGRFMVISMRHTDAIYKIDMKTGDIVWKLGGTPTPESLDVVGDDEHGDYPFGGQHDVRIQPDGTITVYDNRTQLNDGPPRLTRWRINEKAGTARLVESVTDPEMEFSFCCGSARRMPSGNWLADWGANPLTAAYDDRGRRLYTFRIDNGFSYRANPVPKGAVTRNDLRRAMDRMAAGG